VEQAAYLLHLGDALNAYGSWPVPAAIISDGAYGVCGFHGDTTGITGLGEWYLPRRLAAGQHGAVEDAAPISSHEDQMHVKHGNNVPASPVAAFECHRPALGSGVMAVWNRMYPDARAAAIMRDLHCAHARFVWNLCVEQQSWWRPGRGNAPGNAGRMRQLAEARAAEPWLRAGSSSVQQQALRDFGKAMAAFFDPGNPAGRPRFRSKRGPQGFVIRDTKVRRLSRRWGEVHVPKCGWVRFRWTRRLPGKPGMARVALDRAGRWHVSFPAPQPAVQRKPSGTATGIDRGVRTALVTSDGQHYRAPRISGRDAARYLGLQRRLARQQKGSRRREKTRQAMAKITAKTADRRRDWSEKISTRLVRGHDVIVLEKLNTPGMVRRPAPKQDPDRPGAYLPNRARAKAGLNRGILASCWGILGDRLKEKAAASGVTVVFADPRFTSQQCRVCGHIASSSRESQAVFRCVNCGHADHADTNAAHNILARGLASLDGGEVPARACGQAGLRPRKTGKPAAGTTRSAA
jgi:transposase